MVLKAHSPVADEREAAWRHLVGTYGAPVSAYFRGRGIPPSRAEEMTQDFFGDLFQGQALGKLQRDRGRFRVWLSTCLQNRSIDEWRRISTARAKEQSCDTAPAAATEAVTTPAQAFDRSWSATILRTTIEQLEARYQENDRRKELFRSLLVHAHDDPDAETLSAIAIRLRMNPGSVRNAHQLFRQQFRDILRQTVAATVGSAEEIDDEIAHLRGVFAR